MSDIKALDRIVECPIRPDTCQWKGKLKDMKTHLTDEHSMGDIAKFVMNYALITSYVHEERKAP